VPLGFRRRSIPIVVLIAALSVLPIAHRVAVANAIVYRHGERQAETAPPNPARDP
jgi:hypothetical protein